jgi:hypothetical protein
VTLPLYMGMGYLCGSIIGLLTPRSNLALWKTVGTIVPLADFAFRKFIDLKAEQQKWSKPNVVLLKGLLTTAEYGMATAVFAIIGFTGFNETCFFLASTAFAGYCAKYNYEKEIENQKEIKASNDHKAGIQTQISDLSTGSHNNAAGFPVF